MCVCSVSNRLFCFACGLPHEKPCYAPVNLRRCLHCLHYTPQYHTLPDVHYTNIPSHSITNRTDLTTLYILIIPCHTIFTLSALLGSAGLLLCVHLRLGRGICTAMTQMSVAVALLLQQVGTSRLLQLVFVRGSIFSNLCLDLSMYLEVFVQLTDKCSTPHWSKLSSMCACMLLLHRS